MKKTERLYKYDRYSREQIQAAIEQMVHSEKHRQILSLWLLCQISYEEIAERANVSVKTVQRAIDRHEWNVFRHIKNQ